MKSTKMKTTIGLIVMCALMVGCDSGSQQANSNQAASSHTESDSHSHPNLSLHKPKTFASAVQRLKQMHESLLADGEFPEPITIQYVEVIHGTGASGHSHFYSAADYEASGDEHKDDGYPGEHSAEDETVKHRSMEVDLRKELTDIAGWVPGIAAKSNLNETDWNSIKSTSIRLSKIIGAIESDAADNLFRESWVGKSEEIESILDELQTFADSSSGETK